MQIRPRELDKIRSGEIDLAFRRWDRPRLLVGTKMRTKVGLVEVTSVDRVAASSITAAEAQRAGAATRKELMALLEEKADRPVYRVGVRFAGDDPRIGLRNDAALTDGETAHLNQKLKRLDEASPRGPWTRRSLELIAANPARRAPDLAAEMGYEAVVFKRNIRKLKELGLTESLEVGYRLSPRGVVLTGLQNRPMHDT